MKAKLIEWVHQLTRRLAHSLIVGGMLLSCAANASFQLESTGIILSEQDGRISFDIRNTSSSPILLASKLEDLDPTGLSKRILISPPITRIDAGQSQQVNFVLRKGEPLTHEVMLKASFEGIMQTTENSTQMPVRQSIGFIVQPAAVAVSKTPWDALTFQMENGELVMRNTGQRVVRMVPTLQLNPTNAQLAQDEYYLMAGETRRFKVANAPISVTFTPLSRYGFKLEDVTILVK
ncbi:TPA: fimbria/pilus chaperone family protein [Serratia marcescens]